MNFRQVSLLSLTLMLSGLSGCSVDMFSKVRPDASIQGQENYRRIGPECSGLQIKKSELDPATLKALIRCFNSNGSIPEFAALVNEASEKTIAKSVEIINVGFLSDPKILAESRGVIKKLDAEKKWESLVSGFRSILQDPERLRALIRLLSLGGRSTGKTAVKPQLIPEMIENFSATETMAGFELLGRLVRTQAFRELQKKMKESPLPSEKRAILVTLLVDFFKRKTPHHSASLLLDDMVAGKGSALWSFAFGSDTDEPLSVLNQSSRFYTLLRDFGAHEGRDLRQLSLFHRSFYYPVSCWGGGKVFAEPWNNLNEEILQHSSEGRLLPFFTRFASLTAMSIGHVCDIPAGFFQYYPAVMRITLGRSGGEYLGIVKHIFTAGMGSSAGYFVGEWGESLADVLAIVSDRPWFPDLVLLLAQLDSSDRDRIATWVSSLLKNREAWTEKSASWSTAHVGEFFSDIGSVFSADPDQLSIWIETVQGLFESSRAHPWFQGWKKMAIGANEMDVSTLTALPSFPAAARTLGDMAGDGRLAAVLGDILELLGGGSTLRLEANAAIREIVIPRTVRHAFSGVDLREVVAAPPLDDSLRACAQLDLRKRPAQQWEIYSECLAGGGVGEPALAGLLKAQRSPFPGETNISFLTSLSESVFSLPLSMSEKQEVIKMLTGKRSDRPALSADSLLALAGMGREWITPMLPVFSRIQTSVGIGLGTWRTFFSTVESALLDVRFVPAIQSLRGLVKLENPYYQEFVGPAAEPGPRLLLEAIGDVECLPNSNEARARAAEITREFHEGALGWEPEIIQPRIRALSHSLRSDSLRSNLYHWIAGLDPKVAANWFFSRSQDPQLVALIDPDSKRLLVRWMTSLDRFESILVNSNFSHLISGNYGLRFVEKFAESWGDEPRDRWPREIQERYSGRSRPPTLRETYEGIRRVLHGFEKIGGMPTVPSCVKGDLASRPRSILPDFVLDFSVKTKAYNLKQTLSVIEENLPDSGTASAGGMRLLRDLFWAVNSSAPAKDRNPSRPEKNPILFLQRFGDIGGLRLLSRGLQKIETRGELAALEDVFSGLAGLVAEPALDRILHRAILSPTSVETWVSAAFDSNFSKGIVDLFSAIAVDRSLRIGSPLLRALDQMLPSGSLPEALVADLIRFSGRDSVDDRSTKLTTLRPRDATARKELSVFSQYFRTHGMGLLHTLPVAQFILLLDRDPLLRKDFFNEVARISTVRQSNGETLKPFLDLVLSAERPELRRMIALWCGKSASRYVFEFGAHSEEMSEVIDGLLQSADSASFRDLLEALLRQVPD